MAAHLDHTRSCGPRVRRRQAGPILLLVLLAAIGAARAGVSYDVTVGLPIGDDARVFLNITNRTYAPPQETATTLIRRCPHPEDDYPVVLFLSQAAGRPPAAILDLRLRGMAWADILFSLHVRPGVLFTGLDRDPGPPYGKAWGHWKKQPKDRLVIGDREFVDLVKIQVTTRHYGVSPYTVIAERRKGTTVERYVRSRHEARTERASSHPPRAGKPKGHPKPRD